MKTNQKRQRILLVAAIVVFLLLIAVIILTGMRSDGKQKIGFIMTGSVDDDGWNGMHYSGVIAACEQLGTKVIVKENVSEGSGRCAEAIKELADEGVGMIILSSYSYPHEVIDVVNAYPDIAFYAISSEYTADNLTSFFGRIYQARYLSGIVAGMQSKSGRIGYVAAMPNNEVNRGINAFTLGVKKADPDAEVYVVMTGSWDDAESEIAAVHTLIDEHGADVITYHQNQHRVAAAADEAGVYSIGYNEVAEGLSERYLGAVIWKWDSLYYRIIREYLQGQPNSVRRHWFDIDSGVVDFVPISSVIDIETIHMLEAARASISAGNAVFSGEIYDNKGTLQCGENEMLSDESLLNRSDWYVDGVNIV